MMNYNRSDYFPFLSWLLLITIASLFIFIFSSCNKIHASTKIDTISNQSTKTDTVPKKWSLGIYGGVIFPSAESPIVNMPCISIEAEYNLTSHLTLIVKGTYNFIKTYEFSFYEQGGLPKESSRFFEVAVGCKYYFGKFLPRIFIETNVLYYKLKYQFENWFWEVENSNSGGLGYNAGIG